MLAKKHQILEKLFVDVRDTDKNWAHTFAEEANSKGAQAVLVIWGFPCKCLSKARGTDRENLGGKDSKLF